MSWKLSKHKVHAFAAMEGNPIDYVVRRDDGVTVHACDDGNGGELRISDVRQGKRSLMGDEGRAVERELILWAAKRTRDISPEVEEQWLSGSCEFRPGWNVSVGDLHCWVEDQANRAEWLALAKRTAKRTVGWHLPGETDALQYAVVPRGYRVTPSDRAKVVEQTVARHPDAVIYGHPDDTPASVERRAAEQWDARGTCADA